MKEDSINSYTGISGMNLGYNGQIGVSGQSTFKFLWFSPSFSFPFLPSIWFVEATQLFILVDFPHILYFPDCIPEKLFNMILWPL